MKKTLKKVACLSLATAMSVVTLGCQSTDNSQSTESNEVSTTTASVEETTGSEEIVTIQFWKASSDETRNEWWETKIAEFEEEYPNIKVEYLGIPGASSDFSQKLDMAIAAGEVPDVISTFLDSSLITRDVLEPLDSYWDSWENNWEIPQQYIDIYKSMDYSSDEPKLYATPVGSNVQCWYVRPDLLEEAGLTIPETWDDFFEAAEKTTDKDQGIYGYIIRGGGGNVDHLQYLMYSYSGITDFFVDGKCTVNDPLNVEFVEKYLGGYGTYTSEDDINKSWTEMASQFQAGKAVMMCHNLGSAEANYAAFDNDESKIQAIPYFKSKTGKIVIPSFKPAGNMIMKESTHKDEAWTFLKWLAESEQDTQYHELMANMPINTESLKADWIQNISYMKMGADMYENPDLEFCVLPYYLPNFDTIGNDYVSPSIQKVMLGEMTAQEFLDGWAELLQEDYDSVMK
jgi:multiple sugar transport system substrate-binding protein